MSPTESPPDHATVSQKSRPMGVPGIVIRFAVLVVLNIAVAKLSPEHRQWFFAASAVVMLALLWSMAKSKDFGFKKVIRGGPPGSKKP